MFRALLLTLSFESGGRREAVLTLARGMGGTGSSKFQVQSSKLVACDLTCVEELGCEPGVVEGVFGQVEALGRGKVGTGAALARLVRLCDERGIDLIHAHDAASQWIAARVKLKRPKIRLVMTFHRSLGFESAGWKAKLRNAVAGLATAAIVVGSRERREHYLSENFVNAAKVVRIPFGIDLDRFRPDAAARSEVRRELGVADNELLIGAMGHFGPEKGIDVAVQAFLAFRERESGKSAKLLVVGRGSPEQEQAIRQMAASAGQAVCFVGFRRDAERCFAAMDVFMHLPRQEAFGLVVAEALGCGLPVLGAAVGGVPDMVREGETGLLVSAEQPAAGAAALSRLAGDTALRERLSVQAVRVARAEYSEQLYVRRHLDLYEQILAGKPPCGVDQEAAVNETQVSESTRRTASAVSREACDV